MKKTEVAAFADFMLDEATKYGRALTKPEIDLWFETFQRCTLEDFKLAWVAHKRDDRNGNFFPKIPWLQRHLRVTGDENVKRDWRCVEEVGGTRCGYPGAINVGHGQQCAAHYHLRGTVEFNEAASLQIIETSRSYAPPADATELMDRGAAQRATEAERWRKGHPELYRQPTQRKAEDAITPKVPQKPDETSEPALFDDVNAMAQLAAADGGA